MRPYFSPLGGKRKRQQKEQGFKVMGISKPLPGVLNNDHPHSPGGLVFYCCQPLRQHGALCLQPGLQRKQLLQVLLQR